MENLIDKLYTKTAYIGLMTLKNGVNKFVCIDNVDDENNKCNYTLVTKELAEGYYKTGDTFLYENGMREEIALSDIICYYPYDELTTIIKEFEDIECSNEKRMGNLINALVEKNSRKR